MSESIHLFPPLNASLNALSGLFLLAGFAMIKRGDRRAHAACMIGAVSASVVFLACYLTYHFLKGDVHTTFPEEYPLARKIYYPMLISHIILAAINLPMIIVTVTLAARRKFETHRRWARVTFPTWLYVSVTGVLVYFMLYQWFPPKPAAAAVEPGSGISIEPLEGGGLVFEPEVFTYDADPSEQEFTATYQVFNRGTNPVTITELDSACTCLSVSADRMRVKPGGQATITAVFDISKLVGESEKTIFVATDDPEMPRARLGVEVSIPPIVEISPTIVEWAVGEEPAPKEIVFKVLREEPIRIVEATSSRKQVSLEVKTVEEGREYRLVLTPSSTEDILLGFVSITTDCELEHLQRHMGFYAVKDAND